MLAVSQLEGEVSGEKMSYTRHDQPTDIVATTTRSRPQQIRDSRQTIR